MEDEKTALQMHRDGAAASRWQLEVAALAPQATRYAQCHSQLKLQLFFLVHNTTRYTLLVLHFIKSLLGSKVLSITDQQIFDLWGRPA